MDETATEKPKAYQTAWPLMCNPRSHQLPLIVEMLHPELLKAHGEQVIKVGEISYGFVSQKFSGGGTTQQLWGGEEFGSNKFKQFPIWSGRYGGVGSRGWFIYPTLRAEQPHIIEEWENAFTKILKEW
jgi:hypothetical protein